MIPMFLRRIVLAAFMAIGLLGTSAHADLIITIQEDAGPVTVLGPFVGSPSTPPIGVIGGTLVATTPDYTIVFLSAQEHQDGSTQLLTSNTSITNTTGSAGHVLHITVTGTGFTSPVTPPDVAANSHIGGTVSVVSSPSTNSLSFTSSVSGAVPVGPFSPQTPSITTVGSYANDQARVITSLTGPFSIVQTLDITLNALGDTTGFQASTTLTATPEPSNLVLAGLGTVGMIGYGLRRRKALRA